MTETFIQRPTPEPIQAFQAVLHDGEGPDEVLEAFGLSIEDDWTFKNTNGKWALSFERPKNLTPEPASGIFYTISWLGLDSSTVVVHDGDWIVTKYFDTDYPEVSVLNDVAFQRQYKSDWFFNATVNNYT